MRLLSTTLLAIGLLLTLSASAADNKPRTDGFYRAQGSGDKVESARVFWIKFTGQTMLLEFYNTEGEKLREYFKYSEYKFFPLNYVSKDNGITATDKLHEYQIKVKGDELQVTTVKGDKLPAKFVFVPEAVAQNERKGISKTPNASSNTQQVTSSDQPKEKKKCCKRKKSRN